jgi:Ca2+-binding EF-hand superfamily protein
MKLFRGWFLLISLTMILLILGGASAFSKEKMKPNSNPKGSKAEVSLSPIQFEDLKTQIDVDKDGFITQDEWNQFFLRLDENKDNRLSFEEVQGALRSQKEDTSADPDSARIAAFNRLDADKNGVIDFKEWLGKKRTFRYLDLNHDNVINKEEFASKNARWWNMVFEDLDLDGNKVITRSEWMDSDREFDRLDRNHNGGIERKEFYSSR